ncbi:hypothetical protein HOU00_gp244 [Caulobacter phage CcrPW]|uniref:Uncharacterized protein n=1 Tax=Caulobacter phage CcrPW TaxID=2283271 RepID=A0A385EAG9_9CAUD|nr:hypothetical protein HOU00_gp244 [Caulobacter phage CcrPW]AXQ68881.1 hypothetical protein CcrPW_gp342 [Caulobacter phage CcrPW]
MGIIRHHAIVVTSHDADHLREAHAKAVEIFGEAQASLFGGNLASVSEITVSTQGHASFVIAPDGSKEFWDHSDLADKGREAFIVYLNGERHADPSMSSGLAWAEAQFGGPNDDDMLLSSVGADAKKLYAAVARIAYEGHARPEYPSYTHAGFDVLTVLETIGMVFVDSRGNYLLTGSGFECAGYVARDHPFIVKAVTHNSVMATA